MLSWGTHSRVVSCGICEGSLRVALAGLLLLAVPVIWLLYRRRAARKESSARLPPRNISQEMGKSAPHKV